ncbi:MAG: hypothetical protein KGJ23_12490 [Euryarchaeota archaeon]|nr:hypothetical protein [Euryarchaeota archaeon]MDE1837416.1 hypothetical protein [Euryarchaeota archaeon]MDE1879901.1 hypothetical protein [Euryarchaeota archaeon]MDE2045484.1 hypothetical protein [Thermoplasmata archaeon]
MAIRPEEIIVHEEVRAAHEAWESLARQGRQPAQAVWKSLQTCILRLRSDAQWGEVVRQELIPRYFREKYGVSNLYCIDLAAFHRCLYTIANRSVILLDIVDHPTYDGWFPGRRSR